MKKRFKAFTLVEMLIVMGIIIILMAVGIASGRYAISRANQIEHQNAAEQIYQALQSYYADHREYPDNKTPQTLVTTDLAEYIDNFDGGSEASYYYYVDGTNQIMLVCVTYGGVLDESQLGAYCTGNGINSTEVVPASLKSKDLEYSADAASDYGKLITAMTGNTTNVSTWTPGTPW